MCAYRFHCSNGAALVIDEAGHEIETESDLCERAADVALDILLSFPASDPSAWIVTIQDEDGRQVEVMRFDELLDLACRRRDALEARRPGHVALAQA